MSFRFLIASLLCAATSVCAQTYPNKPVKLVVPFGAGSATDTVARQVGQLLSEALGQQFIVDNKAGANGSIGADIVKTLNAEVVKALARQDIRDKLAASGLSVQSSSPEQLAAFQKLEIAKWATMVKDAGIQPE